MKIGNQPSKCGAVLAEVLLTIVIVSVALVVIVQAMTASAKAARLVKDDAKHIVLLENILARLQQSEKAQNDVTDDLDLSADTEVEITRLELWKSNDTIDVENDWYTFEDVAVNFQLMKNAKSRQLVLQTYLVKVHQKDNFNPLIPGE